MSGLTRREFVASAAALIPSRRAFRLATFSVGVTPPVGHPLLAGLCPPATGVEDPLYARGFALLGGDKPVVVAAVDWCEIRNDAFDRWRSALAEAAGTSPDRVLVSSVHQHDAPLADLEAQRILETAGLEARIIDLEFHERAVGAVATALRLEMKEARAVTHVGLGKAEVREIASNRRYLGPDGKPRHNRMSANADAAIRDQPEGTIDPFLRTLSFWEGDRPLAALSVYATHPMSYYRTGRVSADFPGIARARRQAEDPRVLQIYGSGASGNVTPGKYNDGSPPNRGKLAERLHAAMAAAWRGTERHPLERATFRSAPLRLEPRADAGFTADDLGKKLRPGVPARDQAMAALGMSWRRRVEAGRRLEVPAIDFGPAQILLLPGESYVEYQLLAQKARPDSFVLTLGYGECAPGYIPIERAWEEKDGNLRDWCWVAPGTEREMTAAIEAALGGKR